MRDVAVAAVAMTPMKSKHADVPPTDLTRKAVLACLEQAGATPKDLDAIVFGTMDPFDGVNKPEHLEAGATLGTQLPYMKISTGGTTGLTTGVAAYQHVASGLFDSVLAICTQRVGEAPDAQPILNTCVDPIYERHVGVGAISVGALQGAAHMKKYGSKPEDFAAIAAKDHTNASVNERAHLRFPATTDQVLASPMVSYPLRLMECCPRSDGAVAVLFASKERVREFTDNPAWVLGESSISDSYPIGDRPDLARWDTAALCARRAYRMAGIENPRRDLDAVELYSPFTSQEVLELEAFGLAPTGQGHKLIHEGVTARDGDIPTAPSGGVLCTNPIGATGLVRLAEASLQVTGQAGACQVPDADTALAHAWGGTAQFHALMIVGNQRRNQ